MAQEKKKAPTPSKGAKKFDRYKMYSVSGATFTRKNKACPKCGPESFLANHKDRLACGKCGYVEKR